MRHLLLVAVLSLSGYTFSEEPKKADAAPKQAAKQDQGAKTSEQPLKVPSAPIPQTVNVVASEKVEHVAQSSQSEGNYSDEERHSDIKLILDFFLLCATIAIAIYTARLFRVTRGLLRSAEEQFPHFKENVAAATKAANAASENVATLVASERAYVFVEVQLDVFSNVLMGSEVFGTTKAEVKFWNYGKTPAVITMIRGYIIALEKTPQRLLDFEGAEKELPPSLGIATNCAYPVSLQCELTLEEFSKIKNLEQRIFFVGKLEYRTIHDKACVTGFCWEMIYRDLGSTIAISRDSQLNIRT